MLSKLLASGATVDVCDGDGRTPLHWAAVNGHEEIVNMLAQARATLDVMDKDGKTPFAYACYQGHTQCAKVLLARGAAIDQLDKERTTASFEHLVGLVATHFTDEEKLPLRPGAARR